MVLLCRVWSVRSGSPFVALTRRGSYLLQGWNHKSSSYMTFVLLTRFAVSLFNPFKSRPTPALYLCTYNCNIITNSIQCDGSFCLKGPFASFETRFSRVCEWTGIKFSNNGEQILISSNGGMIRVLNAFNGSVLHTFSVRHTSKLEIFKSKWSSIKLFVCLLRFPPYHEGLQQQ